MRTEKEIRDKIDELKEIYFDINNNQISLSRMTNYIQVLSWALGKDYKFTYKITKNKGAMF